MARLPICRTLSILMLFVAALSPRSQAQAVSTAHRAAGISVYAAGSSVATDYASTDYGFMVGADFTYHLRYFDPSLDVRYNHATGSVVGEHSFAGGAKIERTYFNRLHPYVHFLIGVGEVDFATTIYPVNGPPYSHDNSKVYDFGGGLDYDLTHSFALKIDGQYQFWHLGEGDNLNPTLISFGLVFRVPYRHLRPH